MPNLKVEVSKFLSFWLIICFKSEHSTCQEPSYSLGATGVSKWNAWGKSFLKRNLSRQQAQVFIKMFQEILKQEYSTAEVCRQIQRSMDHPSRLELMHVLFGLSASDGEIHPEEVRVIHTISGYLNISNKDYESIKAIFIKDIDSTYKILEIDPSVSDNDVKKAYRKMAVKYHPDKVAHLGKEIQKTAEEKFKAVSDAYSEIKKQRKMS